ncbi:MAG: OsmC family protein [Deltaproteobacteria bacterium]|nr:OsmC family protein [Deltaproteobacteria bacterium]
MTQHRVTVRWERAGGDFSPAAFDPSHQWLTDGGVRIAASSAPALQGMRARLNPQEALVAALASSHMLAFLAVAAQERLVVDHYEDSATGALENDADGKPWLAHAVLRPRVTWAPGSGAGATLLSLLHHRAHGESIIARSVRTAVTVEPA